MGFTPLCKKAAYRQGRAALWGSRCESRLRLISLLAIGYKKVSEMGDYTGVAGSIFDEPEYRDQTELVMGIYLITKSDMIGVCPLKLSTVASHCRTSPAKVKRVLAYFQNIKKLTLSQVASAGHKPLIGWWHSKIWHTMYKGKASHKQLIGVSSLIRKWDASKAFGDDWALRVAQLYETKYNIKIPIPNSKHTLTDESESYIQTETESEAHAQSATKNVDNSKKRKIVEPTENPKLDSYRQWKLDNYEELIKLSEQYQDQGGTEWVQSHTLDIETDIIEKPDKYLQIGGKKSLNWVVGWLKRSAEQNQAGDCGMKEPMTEEQEAKHYERHRDNASARGSSKPTAIGDVTKKLTGG